MLPPVYRFRNKYHPRDAAIRQKEALKSVKKRLAVFLDLLSAGRMDKVTLDVENTDAIIKVLDAGRIYGIWL